MNQDDQYAAALVIILFTLAAVWLVKRLLDSDIFFDDWWG